MSFLEVPRTTAEVQGLYERELADAGFVMNASRLWAYQPATHDRLFQLMQQSIEPLGLTRRQRGILITACASTLGDAYCSLAWGTKLAEDADAATAAAVLRGDDGDLSMSEQAMAAWARTVAGDPNRATGADVQALRDAGYGDEQIFAITVFVALRLAFSTVNDALGARPDAAYRSLAPAAVRDAVGYGRPIAD